MEGNMPTETTNRIMNIEIMKGHARVRTGKWLPKGSTSN